MVQTLPSDGDSDKASASPWDRARVLREAQTLYSEAPESAVRLKCLEMILDMLPPDPPKKSAFSQAAEKARKARS